LPSRQVADKAHNGIFSMTKQISISRGMTVTVDDSDFDSVKNYRWFAVPGYSTWYAMRWEGGRKNRKHILLHRSLMGITDGSILIDHKNGNGLDCTRSNMRVCTKEQNSYNRGKQKSNTTGYKGVYQDKKESFFSAQIGFNGKRIRLGYFKTKEEAAHAYNEAAKKYHGEFAKLNKV
jgi:hypothetical protein